MGGTGGAKGPVIVVLGMHRSGTSWLAGELQERGLPLGEVNMSSRYNERGNRENPTILNLHENVLRASGGQWNKPPRHVVWTDAQRKSLHSFIDEMDEEFDGSWGCKDPRTLLTFDEWQQQLNGRMHLVGIFRHPQAVAASLLARELSPRDRVRGKRHAFRLWNAYCERLVALHQATPFPLIRFDSTPEDLEVQLSKAVDALGVSLDTADEGPANFAPELVHEESGPRVPRNCARTWSYLTAHQIR
jgi:hypothetical protein